MQGSSLVLWSRCRWTLFPPRATVLGTTISQRWRTGTSSAPSRHSQNPPWRSDKKKLPFNSRETPWKPYKKPTTDQNAFDEDVEMRSDVRDLFLKHLKEWEMAPVTMTRLQAFGIPQRDVRALQTAFVEAVNQGAISGPEFNETLELFKDRIMGHSREEYYQRLVTSIFYSWACDPARSKAIVKSTAVPAKILDQMRRLRDTVANLRYPAERFPAARSLHRKIIMHVGPTNSGKTHNALRALAASQKGIYAGPLRLLAHEIWERLNLGEIVPLGVDMNAPPPVITTAEDGNEIIPYARECNLITGEEQKIVSEHAPLMSCTVEMVPYGPAFDVAVIDEIQMIADPERGGGWTNAVLGLNAKEIHLCGEEAAVPIIRELLKDTGDDFEVKRYERLTPLTVADKSLNGDFKNIRKGDCLIAFSRTGIYALKRRVEQASGLRCAVAYGLLPPELRSEQAALFNDPNSGYDVMIGSDAIGMGLNL
jgi:ATP-dependent RNA helicase SUPV3L1/SUV3